MAHPDRLAILLLLMAGRARTATECAGVVPASASACSYHLRELERFGFVERVEVSPPADRRARWWRASAIGFSLGGPLSGGDVAGRAAFAALRHADAAENDRLRRSFVERLDELPAEWQDAAEFAGYELDITAAELRLLNAAVDGLLRPYRAGVRPQPPPGTRVRARRVPGLSPNRRAVTSLAEATPSSVWRSRNFRLAWASGLVNDTGDWVLIVALPVYVFTETGSGTSTATLFVCQLVVAAILGPLGGSLVDRWDLRRCIIATNVAQAVMLLPLFAVTPTRVWPAFVAITGQAALSQVNNPANVALLPRLVRPAQLTAANAAQSASSSIARLLGSPLGGVLVALGGLHVVVVVDLISYLAVAVAMAFVTADTGPRPATIDVPHGVRAGLVAIRTHPPLPAVLAIHGLSQLAQGAFVVLFVVFVIDALDGDGTTVGVIRGTMAVGAIVGAIVIGRVGRSAWSLHLLALGYVGMGIVALAFWNTPRVTTALWAYLALFALSGLPGATLTVGLFTTVQTTAPSAILGRVIGVLLAAEAVGAALGSILAGLLVDHLPLDTLLDTQAAIYLCCGLLLAALVRSRPRAPI